MDQEASDPGAASQETEFLAAGDLAENPAESSKAPVQSALESDGDSSSDDSENSSGPGFGSSNRRQSEEEDSDDFVEEVPAQAGNPKANDEGSGAAGAATASAPAQAQGACAK